MNCSFCGSDNIEVTDSCEHLFCNKCLRISRFNIPKEGDTTIIKMPPNKDMINILNETKAKVAEHDPVNHPSHYISGTIECIDAIKAATEHLDGFEGYCAGNAIKYLWRWKLKNGIEDIKKAQWYLNHIIKQLDEEDTDK